MKVLIAAGGRFHSFHLARQLNSRGCLKKIFTTSYADQDKSFLSSKCVEVYKFGNFLDKAYLRFYLSHLIGLSSWYVFKDNLFDRWLSKQLQNIEDYDIFVGWTNYWLKSLPMIKKSGAKIIAESGSMHILEQSKILEDEYKRFGLESIPIVDKNVSKMVKEYEVADYVMVPAEHVRQSFIRQGIVAEKLLKVPYGVDFNRFYRKRECPPTKFRVIFVGQLSLQKGVHYLLEAWSNFKLSKERAELILVGPMQKCFRTILKSLEVLPNVIFRGSIDQNKLIEEYKTASVFVLPSIQDGIAMVQAEAMASGLPVICTTNTGGGELIENGKEGFILPIRDVDALAEKILWCYENREECFEMGLRAQQKIKNYTWDHYGEKIIKTYREILQR